MKRKSWYLLAYDIANPRRLAKVHNVVKKTGIAVQKSLFFVHGTEPQVHKLLNRIASSMLLSEDDLRAYPITHPENVWTSGDNPLAQFPMIYLATQPKKLKGNKGTKSKQHWLKRFLGL